MNAPPSQKTPMPYGILPTDKPYPVELESCSRCGRALEPGEGSSSVVGLAEGLLWIYCAICTGSTGYGRGVT
ncbi:MAG: hypothetical protein OXK73_12965 [Rhodospirillaceae bacterium]|nr:hypothetical protein [Rhodospirillaceae bacterium]